MLTLGLSALAVVVSSAVARPPPAAGFAHVFGTQSPIGMAPVPDNNTRVPIVLGVMSRCPDALMCESLFDSALPQTWDIVDINLSFVGKLNDSDNEYGVTCMHGTEECAGNVQELCAISHAHSQQDWWHFLQCLNFEGKDKIGGQALAQRCAGVAYIPWDDEENDGKTKKGIKGCVEGKEGKDLLKASVKQSQDWGIEKSCTIMISGQKRCVRDGTWKECETGHTAEELISYIKDEYNRLNSQTSANEGE